MRAVWYTAIGAGFVTLLRLMVLAWLIVVPPAKSLSATNVVCPAVTPGPPALIATRGGGGPSGHMHHPVDDMGAGQVMTAVRSGPEVRSGPDIRGKQGRSSRGAHPTAIGPERDSVCYGD